MKEKLRPYTAQHIAEQEQGAALASTDWLLKSIMAMTTIRLIFKRGTTWHSGQWILSYICNFATIISFFLTGWCEGTGGKQNKLN